MEEALRERDSALTALNEALRTRRRRSRNRIKSWKGFPIRCRMTCGRRCAPSTRSSASWKRIMASLERRSSPLLDHRPKAAVQAGELIDDLLEFPAWAAKG